MAQFHQLGLATQPEHLDKDPREYHQMPCPKLRSRQKVGHVVGRQHVKGDILFQLWAQSAGTRGSQYHRRTAVPCPTI
jgi:hypothetical protein